ncbi:MAG: S-layer homology domain-containing protein [Oscillospiraceae bacterium]|nr:S-layer homology domain-containing protein [Oscillospiraceae bacterium]
MIGDGSATVQATKSGKDPSSSVVNYDDAIASWTFTAGKKPVTATVTAEDKFYDGNAGATVHAVVEQGVLPGDEIKITGLTGTFSDANAGVDKTVTVNKNNAGITGKNSEHYDVSYSSLTVKATIHKKVVKITTHPTPATLTYNGTAQELLDVSGLVVDTPNVQVEYALSEDGPYSAAIPKGTNAGKYTVWYRVQETGNYTGVAPASVDVEINKKPVPPSITLSGDGLTVESNGSYSYIYDGNAKEPVVTLTEADGSEIPAGEYTVEYSNNINVGTTATVTVTAKADGNYVFTPDAPVTITFEIKKEQAKVVKPPEAAGYPLTFSNFAQRLVTAGTGDGGTMVYSVDGENGTYEETIPTETNAAEYTVYYKVKGDDNHSDSDVGSVKVTIAPKNVKDPTIDLLDDNGDPLVSYTYDSHAKEPTVVVKDGSDIIGVGEYNLVYTDNIDAGKGTVNVTDKPGGNYTVTGSAEFVIVKADIVFTQVPADANITYDGQPHELVTPGVTNGGTVLYALNSPTSTYKDAIPEGTEAGTYTVYYKVVGDKNHNDLTPQSVSVTIQRKPLISITIELSPEGFAYDGEVKLPEVTVKDGETVLPAKEYTWSCDDPSPTNVGDYTITISDATGGNYDLTNVANNTATFAIGKIPQEELVIGGKPSTVSYGDNFKLTVSDGIGAETWKVDGPATIDTDGNVKITDVGEVTVTVKRAGDNNYLPAQAQWTFTAEPKAVTASIVVANKVYDGNTIADVTSASIPVLTGDTVTIDPDSITASFDTSAAGTGKTVTLDTSNVKVTGDDAEKYDITYPATETANITPKHLTVSVTLSDHDLKTDSNGKYYYVYDGTEKEPAVTVTGTDDDYSVTLTANDYTVSYANNKNASTATVTVTAKADGNYTFDEQKVNFEITRPAAQLTSSPQPKDLTYTGQAQELMTVGTAVGGHIEYSLDGTNYSASIPTETGAGTYTVTYMVKGEGNYADSTDTWTVSVTIKQKEIISPKVTVNGSYTYDGTPQEPVANDIKVEDGNTPIPASEYNVTFRDNVEAGTATVVITNANGGNYIVNGTGTFTIAKANVEAADITVPTGKINLPYNGTAQELVTAGSASGGTMVYSLSETGEYSPAIPTQTAVGGYTIWYKVQGDSNHNDTEPQSVTASIVVNTVTNPIVQVTPESVTYNGNPQKPVVTVKDKKDGHLINGDEYTVTYRDGDGNVMTDLTGVGNYTLTITGTNTNYIFTETATFEILPADQTPLTITNTREHVYYGDKFQLDTSGGNGTVTWKVNDDAPANITNGLLEITGVGSVTVTATSTATGYADQTATWSFYAEEKPVTAVVEAKSRDYKNGDTSVTVTATLQKSDLVDGDKVVITLSGRFEDPNAGTDKKVIVDSSNPDFTGSTGNHLYYNITYPATTTASIFKAPVTDVTDPKAVSGLEYTGLAQALVEAGSSTEGTLEYSTDNIVYSVSLPTGTDAGDYDVWYRVKGDGNHNDMAGKKLDDQVTIAQQKVTDPTIELTPTGASYDGAVHKPSVMVKDKYGRIIPDSEYTVTYSPSGDWKDVGTYTVTITDVTGGNYDITEKDATFEILIMGQSPLSITNQPGVVHYGDTFTLNAVGGSGTGAVTWESGRTDIATIDSQSGLVKVLKSGGPVTITATKASDGNYGATTATWTFSAEKRPARAIVTAKDKEYDGNDNAKLVITWKDGDLLGNDTIALEGILTGKFDNANAGNNKTVTITGTVPDNDKYAVTYNTTTTASIIPKAATVTGVTAKTSLVYSPGNAQELVDRGTAEGGSVKYSLDGGASYSLDPPKAVNAGKYTVWYMAESNSGNYVDSVPVSVSVTIDPKTVNNPDIELTPAVFDYDGTAKKPDVVVKDNSVEIPASEYTVRYSDNVQAGTATVTISDVPGGNYNVSGTTTFTIKSGSAVLTLAPEEKDLTYTGSAQALVRAGAAVNGQVVYSLTGDEDDYSPTIPKRTDAGNYEVWYKVKGNVGYADTAADSVTVTIQPKQVTPTVLVGGALNYSTQYTGSALTPSVTVSVDGVQLDSSKYLVGYNNNTKPGTATVTVQNSGGNYQFFAAVTFEITKAKAEFLLEPKPVEDLVYTGEAQKLVEPGVGKVGTVVYSLNGGEFYPIIPTGTEVGTYVVMAKVQGSEFYTDSDVKAYRVTISKNVLTEDQVDVSLSANNFHYTGYEQKPAVIVTNTKDQVVIPASEYTVTYANNVAVGQASVTVTGTGKNYSFQKTVHFQIIPADQPVLTITGKPDTVYYGDIFTLGTTGGSGAVTWTVESGNAAAPGNGQFQITGSGSITIKAAAADSSDTWTFYAYPKPVDAVVTAASKPYDGNNSVTLTFTISSGLGSGDTAISGTATGYFADVNAGTNKTVVITGLTVSDEIKAKYDIKYPATITADITRAPAKVTTAPEKIDNLTYTSLPQALVDPGVAENGNMAYSLDGVNYSGNVPEGTDAKTYTVWYKAIAADDENYKDSTPVQVSVKIGPNTGTPSILCTSKTIRYDGTEKMPAIVVRDDAGHIIPESEYTVSVDGPAIAVGKYTVTVTDKQGGNYEFAPPVTVTDAFEIVADSQNPLTIVDKPAAVYYGDTFYLSATGGSGSGEIVWGIKETNGVAEINNGIVTVKGTGGFTVTAYRKGADGYDNSNTDSVYFEAKPKPVTPVVTADNKPYDGTTDAKLQAVLKLVGEDTINLTVEGVFESPDVGENKKVEIRTYEAQGLNVDKYMITWPTTTTASIYKVDAKMETPPQAVPNLTYDSQPHELVTGGKTVNGIGTIVYSSSKDGAYSENIPTGTNAGEYTVWYKVAGSVNYTGIDPAEVKVEIAKATPKIIADPTASGTAGQKLIEIDLSDGQASVPGKFEWGAPNTVLNSTSSSHNVIFTPDDTANYETVTFSITVTVPPPTNGGGTDNTTNSTPPSWQDAPSTFSIPSASGTPTQTTVQDGTASTVVSDKDGSDLVREAVTNQSQNVVIKPEITGDVTKTEVFIPSSTVSQLSSETDAALTVSSPVADVTISNAALDTLSQAGGTVSVVAEKTEGAVVLSLAVDGEVVEEVPGGVTLTVPAEDAGPGTVAVLVHEDGTRETIRRSLAADGVMNIPLSGSATVEIVDNSKDFADVPAGSWAADAVAFASAHELLDGTGEETFSPDQAMSRGMLATVLYRLDGSPEMDAAGTFSDVGSDAWYADGVAWAVESGIADGYGDGQFGPDDSITREQFVVMLWRYAGSPETGSQDLDFADADQVSGYAQAALGWAVEKGILSGVGDGMLDPAGTATRAQAAQLLKNFMENT